ncbi:PucR family transcriptional regulator [Streptomyces specialis]|uniref:PucR family transcriptional regulator n=1 Tax=Streptomyces specialis TaxID=498367 RepID=UPI00073EC635|nr:helix-turn-helix domain-containing protein [Streptomyces specialis]
MTSTSDATPRFGGTALHRRLITNLAGLTTHVTRHLPDALPDYAKLPAEQLDGDVRRVVESTIRMLAEILRTGEPPSPEHMAEVRASAAKRAEEGVPIDAVIAAYHVGARACLDVLSPAAETTDLRDVFALQRVMLDHLGRITAAVAAGYLDEHAAEQGEHSAARDSLLSALLAGTDPEPHAARAGITLPATYLVLALAVGPHPDERCQGVDASIAARRKVRRLRAELDRRVGRDALLRLTSEKGLVLVPHRAAHHAPQPDDWQRLNELVAGVSGAAGAEIVAGAQPCAPAGVPAAAELAGELREVALTCGRPGGVYRVADLALEYQLGRPGPARDHLTDLLAPVAERPDLLKTLRVFLATDLNRRRTATLLGVHPNTVDYRLGRISSLTGIDTTSSAALLTLCAGVIALAAAPDRVQGGGTPEADAPASTTEPGA